MLCPGCGKDIPFVGEVCPYCHRDKSSAQGYHVLALGSGLLFGWIGYVIFGGGGAVFGFILGVIGVFVKMGSTTTAAPRYSVAPAPGKKEQARQYSLKPDNLSENLVAFHYVDANGEPTHRTVDVDRVYARYGVGYIEGFCRMREEDRTFRTDRIDGKIYIPFQAELLAPEEYLYRKGVDLDADDEVNDDYQEPVQYWDSCGFVPVKAQLRIDYHGVNALPSTRTIRISEYDGSSYLNAFCELKKQRRTFRIELIKECVDIDSGEYIDNIPQHLLEKYQSSPEYILGQAMEKLSDILMVLYYVGKADGQLRAAERDILNAVVRKIAKDERITDEMINREFEGVGVPSLQAVKLAINRICKSSGHNMETTYKIAQKIVATQKTVHASETEILEYMEKKMKKEGISS
jgi:WYL domain